jgi:hypothetical protein
MTNDRNTNPPIIKKDNRFSKLKNFLKHYYFVYKPNTNQFSIINVFFNLTSVLKVCYTY